MAANLALMPQAIDHVICIKCCIRYWRYSRKTLVLFLGDGESLQTQVNLQSQQSDPMKSWVTVSSTKTLNNSVIKVKVLVGNLSID